MEARATILVVDHQAPARDRAARLLREAGYRVQLAPGGPEALDRFRTEVPDLVLLEVALARPSGLEVLRLFKAATRDGFVPVVLVSSRTDVETRVAGLRAGADDFVCKPFDGEELLARIEALLRIKRGHDELAHAVRELEASSITDATTGLHNHRFLAHRLGQEFARAQRYADPLSLLLIDLDAPPPAAAEQDRLLRGFADALSRVVRTVDLLVRYGGDEFVLVLPSTHFAGALPVAQRVQAAAQTLGASVSIGIAFFPSQDVSSAEDLLRHAGAALGRARQEGAGWVCLHQHQSYLYRPGSESE